jgi:nucleoid-associated protein YgaU
MPDQFDQLKQKYQPVADAIQKEGGQLQNVNMDGNQLYLKATMNSEASKNKVWDAIKSVDPNFKDLKHDIEVNTAGGQSQGASASGGTGNKYTVQPGDNLSEISQKFYGDASKYMTIAKANHIEDPNKIKAGEELIIPAA